MQPDNSADCLIQLLRQLQVPVTRRGVYEELSKHPDHPSLLAFSDVLRTYGVANGAYHISLGEVAQVPTPFVAHISTRGGEFRLIEKVAESHIIGAPQAGGSSRYTPEEFRRVFTGNVLVAEPQPGAGEPGHEQHRRRERLAGWRGPLLVAACVALATLTLWQSASWRAAPWSLLLLLAAKSVGVVVSVLLLAQSLGRSNPLLQRLCGTTSSCNAVLASAAARLTPEISWAEVGFGYFAGTWLALLVLAGTPLVRLVLITLSLLSLPFTLYSLYYQARVAQQWCLLCCTVLAILWLEAGIGTAYLGLSLTMPPPAGWAVLLGCLLTPMLAWLFVKPYLTQAQQAATLQQQLASFKRHRGLFESALAVQPRHELLPPADAIRLGNPAARQILTVVTSPTCPPCVGTHELVKRWLTQRDDLQVQLVFAVPDHPQDRRTQVAAHLLTLHQHNSPTAEAALHDWYTSGQQDYASWVTRHPAPAEVVAATSLARHHAWCQQADVTGTPTILLNGQELPDLYRLEDIQYLL